VEGDTNSNLLFVDASTDRVAIGTNTPTRLFQISADQPIALLRSTGTTNFCDIFFGNSTVEVDGYIRYDNTNSALLFATNGAIERLRLDTAGNLGLGVTPSAWEAGGALQLGTTASNSYSYSRRGLTNNSYFDGSNWRYYASAGASLYQPVGAVHAWYNAPSGTAGNTISFTQAMTLNADGELLIGTTSDAGAFKLQVAGDALLTGGNAFYFRDTGAYVFSPASNVLAFSTNSVERARITADGFFKASNSGSSGLTGLYHEFVTNQQTNHSIVVAGTNASYDQTGAGLLFVNCARSASDLYTFSGYYSGSGADREFQFRGDGNGYADGTWNNNGADYAEFFESATGAALTLGATVVLDGNKVREATADDPATAIMGVVRPKEPSKASMVIGNSAWNKWANKYLTDDFDRYIMEDHDVVEWTDADGKQHSYESHRIPADVTVPADAVTKTHDDKGNKFQHYKLNPAWNPDADYTPREKRDEWIIVGLVGQVKILKGQPVNDRWIKMRDVSATVEEWMIR
jgi:hypothetical protein